ncbi:MAG: hypothetical protein K9H14_02555 [Actinomycetia bacterium]|nr:hypothetical protein [Actinomycetes bacterium]
MKRIILDTRKTKDVGRQGIGCAMLALVFLIGFLVFAIVQHRSLGLILVLSGLVLGLTVLYAYVFFRKSKKNK